MKPHSFQQKTLDALGVLICGAGNIGIKRGLNGAQEFFYHAGFELPIVNRGVFPLTSERVVKLRTVLGFDDAISQFAD